MCGILGYIGYGLDENKFEHSLNRLSHRGPDGFGIWHEEGVLLGHRRLSIIDLSEKAKQPMGYLDRYMLTFNGEIYNYKELRKELEFFGYTFRSDSDTEVLLAAFAQWGKDCLKKLNGMWAFAIWDKKENFLFLSKDRIGKKPLFYCNLRNGFVFASEMKAIYPLLDKVEINYDTLATAKQNNFSYESTESCLIKNIIRFPAGSYGIYKDRKLSIERFWEPLKETIPVPKKYSEQVEMFRELFLDSCRIRMRSDVAIGTALSGGIDSSATICAMNHIAKTNTTNVDWQHAFVATFPGTFLDETEYARTVTDYLNIKADFIEINPVGELNNLFLQSYMFEEIYYAPTIPFVQLYRHQKAKGVTVSVDGHGADELFGGYAFDIPPATIDSMPNIFRFYKITDAIYNCNLKPERKTVDILKYALVNRYPQLRKFSRKPDLQKKHPNMGYFNSRLFESTYRTILPTLLRNYDRYSMMNGVEIRMPFLDYRILQFAFSIPYNSKIRNGYTKAIVRDALKGIVPEKILKRKTKIGFNSPIDVWAKRKEFKEWIGDEMGSSDFKNATTINGKEVKKSIDSLLVMEHENLLQGASLFAKIIPYVWEKGLSQYAK